MKNNSGSKEVTLGNWTPTANYRHGPELPAGDGPAIRYPAPPCGFPFGTLSQTIPFPPYLLLKGVGQGMVPVLQVRMLRSCEASWLSLDAQLHSGESGSCSQC